MKTCDMCKMEKKALRHLPLYAFGSEDVELCDRCCMLLTEVVRVTRVIAGDNRLAAARKLKGGKK